MGCSGVGWNGADSEMETKNRKKSQGNKYRTLKGTRERGFHSS